MLVGWFIMQTQAGDSFAKSVFAQLKAMSFLKQLTGSQVVHQGMMVVIQPSSQEHVTAEAPIV